MTISNRDPLNIDQRAYAQLDCLLKFMEDEGNAIPFKERYAALGIILRLRDLAARREDDTGGSAVRKYASAFTKPQADATRRRKAGARNKADPRDTAYLREIDGTGTGDDAGSADLSEDDDADAA